MTDHRSPLAKARDEWMESADGKRCQEGAILSNPREAQYLRNRLEMAFIAGATWAESRPTPTPSAKGGDTREAVAKIWACAECGKVAHGDYDRAKFGTAYRHLPCGGKWVAHPQPQHPGDTK